YPPITPAVDTTPDAEAETGVPVPAPISIPLCGRTTPEIGCVRVGLNSDVTLPLVGFANPPLGEGVDATVDCDGADSFDCDDDGALVDLLLLLFCCAFFCCACFCSACLRSACLRSFSLAAFSSAIL